MVILVVTMEKTYGCYGTNRQKMRWKNLFDTGFGLFRSVIGKIDGKFNFSAYFHAILSFSCHSAALAQTLGLFSSRQKPPFVV